MSGKGKILVVDDDRLVLATVTQGLADAGYEVIDADNGDDAILLARQHRPDLALLDIRMEGKSGFDVAEYLREVGHTPFLFLSAFADAETAAKVQALGALAYLVKPLRVGELLPTVADAMARAKAMAGSPAGAAQAGPAGVEAGAPRGTTPPGVPARDERASAVGGAGAAAAPTPEALPGSTPEGVQAVAVGVLMHRFSLTRAQAWDRLVRTAQSEARSPLDQARRIVQAVEDLAG